MNSTDEKVGNSKSNTMISRRNLMRTFGQSANPAKLASFGWSWEGQGINAPVFPSVYGVGQGASYFGLQKVFFMFHPNNDLAMEKLRLLDEVVCDITKWKQTAAGYGGAQMHYDTRPATVLEEAQTVAGLSSTYKNIRGAYFDDTLGKIEYGAMSAKEYASVHAALKKGSSNLKLWTLVRTDQLSQRGLDWAGFKPSMDVIYLRLDNAKDITGLDGYIDRCRVIFLDKPIVLACRLWDSSSSNSIPMDLLKLQWQRVLKCVESKQIAGYSVEAAFLIDSVQKEARWVRDFIAAN